MRAIIKLLDGQMIRKETPTMTQNNTTAVDKLWAAAAQRFPEFSPEEQFAGIILLQKLSEGRPLRVTEIAEALDLSVGQAQALLRQSGLSPFVHADDDDRVLGFWGLSTKRMHHRFTLNGQPLWTWCAVDSLFLPELLGETAQVESRDPEGGELVRLEISPTGIEFADPQGIVVSMNSPEVWEISSADQVITSACHHIFFFASHASGARWVEKHPKSVLLPLDDAFTWGQRQNARLFGSALATRSPK